MYSPKKNYSAELSLFFQKVEFILKYLWLCPSVCANFNINFGIIFTYQYLHYELSGRVLLTSLFFSGLELSGVEPEPYFWFRWARIAAWTDGSLACQMKRITVTDQINRSRSSGSLGAFSTAVMLYAHN